MAMNKNWLWPVLMMLVIFGISAVPGKTIVGVGLGPESYHIDGHFVLFLLLCLSYYKATKKVGWSLILTLVYSLTDEFHQLFVPGRAAEWFDIYVDNFGNLIAGLYLWKLLPITPRILRNWLNK